MSGAAITIAVIAAWVILAAIVASALHFILGGKVRPDALSNEAHGDWPKVPSELFHANPNSRRGQSDRAR